MTTFGSKKLIRFSVSLVSVLTVTALLMPFHNKINTTTIALLFLLIVLFSATFFGRNPALLASFAAMLCFNYFFLPPVHTWTISETQNLVAWFAFTLTAVVAGELSTYARKRAEEATRGKAEIERLYNELQGAFEQASQAEALRQSEKLKSALLDAVTHDLRTPLTSIKASVTTLLEDKKEKFLNDDGKTEFLEIINEETDRLNEFIEGMVGIAKVEANALRIRKTWSEITEIINNAIDRARNHLASNHISWSEITEIINNAIDRARNHLASNHITIEIEKDLPSVFVDASSFSEVIYTLLDNAAKYSPQNSKIRISAKRNGDEMIALAIEDEGKGIAPEMREKVFDKFFRAETQDIHTTSSGLGLGLAIARGIVESQGGRIWIEDGSDGFVTKIVFTIPIGDDE